MIFVSNDERRLTLTLQFCRKKDKYPGFDFCGKRCAAQAAKTGQAVKRSSGGKGPLSGPLGNIINILSSNVGNLGSVMNSNGLDPLQVASASPSSTVREHT